MLFTLKAFEHVQVKAIGVYVESSTLPSQEKDNLTIFLGLPKSYRLIPYILLYVLNP